NDKQQLVTAVASVVAVREVTHVLADTGYFSAEADRPGCHAPTIAHCSRSEGLQISPPRAPQNVIRRHDCQRSGKTAKFLVLVPWACPFTAGFPTRRLSAWGGAQPKG
ncbi:MAG: hypothetical protein WCI17_08625, partial [bacterium]